ncbi:DUF1549 domain-containing protein [Planctomicrobium piriforme]|uniref:EF-hand domain-containing protein n=1 Tax=Planctomicrobium piriforme TaxID=1576369 RepID=A0A1I3G2W7_9PLAN|nr:DUF1549 domain-containing protein [Planctomicrobium piriforme]SFI17501.1 Protein of unknown function [Planctomicrobium piriforme]
MRRILAAFCILGCSSFVVAGSGSPDAIETAAQVDQLLGQHFASEGVTPTGLVCDEDFLRRASLDLGGTLPTPGEVTRFGLNSSQAKRAAVVDKLIESTKFGELWASYWTQVIFLRATEQRSRLVQPAFEKWMQTQLNENRPWNDITRDLITATGSVLEDGQTGLIFAHAGEPEEVAAEIARIFMGVQLSCANCHDHPTDSWKREQFHQLAAFLPRVTVRQETPGDPRSFSIRSLNANGPGGRDGMLDPAQVIQYLDRNRDQKLSKQEARGPIAARFDFTVSMFDKDKDGLLNAAELKEAQLQGNQQPGRGSSEYYMPDLKNPSSKGTLLQPAFFLKEVKGPRLSPGADDQARRNALADYVTSKSNRWFAEAFVNRIWSELVGQGFYMPIDDMGPQRQAVNADVLHYLAEQFTATGYDVKWLYRTIANTQAYQRQLAPDSSPISQVPFAAATPTRLRSDQVYHAIFGVFGITEDLRFSNRGRGDMMLQAAGLDPQKVGFAVLFGFDPSTPQADLLGNVPQALFMMNSPQLDSQLRAAGQTRLARLLREQTDNQDALDELYLLVYSRLPTAKETEINLAYVKETGDRAEAFEDVLWALMNSTEFLSKR